MFALFCTAFGDTTDIRQQLIKSNAECVMRGFVCSRINSQRIHSLTRSLAYRYICQVRGPFKRLLSFCRVSINLLAGIQVSQPLSSASPRRQRRQRLSDTTRLFLANFYIVGLPLYRRRQRQRIKIAYFKEATTIASLILSADEMLL